jgi:hypothetical protein
LNLKSTCVGGGRFGSRYDFAANNERELERSRPVRFRRRCLAHRNKEPVSADGFDSDQRMSYSVDSGANAMDVEEVRLAGEAIPGSLVVTPSRVGALMPALICSLPLRYVLSVLFA